MLVFIVLAVALVHAPSSLALTDLDSPVITQELIDAVNSNPDAKWTAGFSERFRDVTVGEFREMLGFAPDEKLRAQAKPSPPRNSWGAFDSIPAPPPTFDARSTWPGRIHTPRNQGKCASCWAYTATSVFADRIAIHYTSLHNENLSPQQLISCDNFPNQNGCATGDPLSAFKNYLRVIGGLTETCYPSTSNVNGTTGICLSTNYRCPNPNVQAYYYKSKGGYSVFGAYAAQQDIYANGPLGAGMRVYQDFNAYNGTGVYKHVSGQFLGMHSVRIIGWGKENNENYWLVANSWGTDWGDKGYFKIKRGTNECGIETDFMSVSG